jgi:hypothetical protein
MAGGRMTGGMTMESGMGGGGEGGHKNIRAKVRTG